ncbi:hypothetical protein niasHT_031822 [Heterodera trifolii]|uniref:Uncharacterized protein n=1 Tax=Heterodera trifolii TaxID=157864 RepID=A0ABD2HY21_9BILA
MSAGGKAEAAIMKEKGNGTPAQTKEIRVLRGEWPQEMKGISEGRRRQMLTPGIMPIHHNRLGEEHGMPGISTPISECTACIYQSGACRCPQASLIWKPDETQQCAYVRVGGWGGEYSTLIWTANYGDFALTFLNASRKNGL